MNPRLLSSRRTAYYKYFIAPFFGFAALLTVYSMVRWRPGMMPAALFLLVWLGLVGLLLWRVAGWKRVELDQDSLLISGFRGQERVPLDQVGEVKERRWLWRTIVIRFRRAGVFGDTVSFKPHLSPVFWRDHPVVAELRHAAAMGKVTPEELAAAQAQDRTRRWVFVGGAGAFFLAIGVFVEAMLRQSTAFRLGLEALRNSPELQQALGQPIEPGLLVGGQLSDGTDHGCAALDYSVHGPRGAGDAHIQAVKAAGEWHLAQVWVDLDSGSRRIAVVGAGPQGDFPCGGPPT